MFFCRKNGKNSKKRKRKKSVKFLKNQRIGVILKGTRCSRGIAKTWGMITLQRANNNRNGIVTSRVTELFMAMNSE